MGSIFILLLHKLEVVGRLVGDHARILPATMDDVAEAFPRVLLHKELRRHVLHLHHLRAVREAVHSRHPHCNAAEPSTNVTTWHAGDHLELTSSLCNHSGTTTSSFLGVLGWNSSLPAWQKPTIYGMDTWRKVTRETKRLQKDISSVYEITDARYR